MLANPVASNHDEIKALFTGIRRGTNVRWPILSSWTSEKFEKPCI